MTDKIISKVKTALLGMQRLSWEQGVAIRAFYECGDIDLATMLAKEAVHRQLADGRMAILGTSHPSTDPGANGIPVAIIANMLDDDDLKLAVKKMENYYLNIAQRTSCNVLTHFQETQNPPPRALVMIDSIYHVVPFLAYTGNYDESMEQFRGFKRLLFDDNMKIYKHQWDDVIKKYVRTDCWGGGTGWAICSAVWQYEYMPCEMVEYKKELADHIIEMIDGMLSFQREDGFFHDVLHNKDSYVESTAGLMLAFGIYDAVRLNIIDKKYLDVAERIFAVSTDKIDEFGLLHDAANPPSFNFAGTSAEGQAFYMLCYAARKRLGF